MRRRMGRPGLVGTMARTAVIAGTATAVSGNVRHKQEARAQQEAAASQQQQQEWEAQQQWAAQQAAAAPSAEDKISQLKALAGLHEQGILTDEEFASEKAKILA